MLENRRRRTVQLLVNLLAVFGLLFTSANALGAGRVEWKSKSLKGRDDSNSWRVEIAIYLPRAPDTAYVPMKFEFQPTAYYERAMVDGDKIVERTVPLEHQQSIIETADVGFLDPGTAKIQSRTKFTFKLTRAHDYACGEYKVTIYDVRNNRKIGTPTKIKLLGENPIIDRRSITFSGEKKKKKDDADEKKESSDEPKDEKKDGDGWDDSEDSEQLDLQNMDDDDMEEGEIKEKPGGCGCRIAESSQAPAGSLLAALLLGVVLWRRREND